MKKFRRLFFLFLEWLRLLCVEYTFLLLEALGIRCSICGSTESTKMLTKQLEWTSNGNIATEPFYVKYERRCCTVCGHMLTSTFAGTEELGNA